MQGERLKQDHADLGTTFGPSNVAIHRVAIPVELGGSTQAAQQAPSVDLTGMPVYLAERRARYLIDVVRAYAQLRDDAAAVDALAEAERIAPDEVHTNRLTHQVLHDLLLRERRSSGLRALAERCQVKR